MSGPYSHTLERNDNIASSWDHLTDTEMSDELAIAYEEKENNEIESISIYILIFFLFLPILLPAQWTTEAYALKTPQESWSDVSWYPTNISIDISPQQFLLHTGVPMVVNIYSVNISPDSSYLMYEGICNSGLTAATDTVIVRIDYEEERPSQFHIYWLTKHLIYQLSAL